MNPCEDWSEEDLELYDAEVSREHYEDLCCEAIQAMNSEIEIEELFLYEQSPQILNWDEVPNHEELCQDIAEICRTIYIESEWYLERV